MNKTLKGDFTDETTMANVADELVNDGIPREKIFIDKDKLEVKVIIPAATESQVRRVFDKHGVKNIIDRELSE